MKNLVILLITIGMFSCEKENNKTLNGSYPQGMKENDLQSYNNCFLPECSNERIVRLLATNVKGKIKQITSTGQFAISYSFTFDSYISFYLCDLPEEFQEVGIEVLFDGEVIDACGIHEAVWPQEEAYNLRITKIKKI